MLIPPKEYCGDKKLIGDLNSYGAKISIFQLYGLIYGCIAATHIVMPPLLIPRIFGEDFAFNSIEEANEILSDLMSLWNRIAMWEPEWEPFIFPEREYPLTKSGLMQLISDDYELCEYFIKGLDMGGTSEDDFSEDGFDALKSSGESSAFLKKFGELIEKEDQEVVPDDFDTVKKLEGIIVDCIRRIDLGLREARIKEANRIKKAGRRNIHSQRGSKKR